MGLVNMELPVLYNGVTKQSPNVRNIGQTEEEINTYNTVYKGSSKRPNTEFIAEISGADATDFFDYVELANGERLLVRVDASGNVYVYDADTGVSKSVSGNPNSYLSSGSNPRLDIGLITIADAVFLYNRQNTITMATTATAARENECYVRITDVKQLTTYHIKVYMLVGGVTFTTYTASFTTPATTTTTQPTASAILTSYASTLSGSFTCSILGGTSGTMQIVPISASDDIVGISVTDTYAEGDTLQVAWYDEIDRVENLPRTFIPEKKVKIIGEVGSEKTNYYVRFQVTNGSITTNAALSEGTWVEELGYETKSVIDNATMPQILTEPLGLGTGYVVGGYSWIGRNVGDTTTSPNPSFVGKKIQDMFLYRNRLGIISEDKVVMSRTGVLNHFYVTSTITALDDDYIDISVSDNDYSNLTHAVTFGNNLLVFSDKVQYVIKSEGYLSASTIYADILSNNTINLNSKPVIVGNNLYVTSDIGDYSKVIEYYLNDEGVELRTLEVTKTVPNYIPSNLFHLQGMSVSNIVLAVPHANRNRIYVYKTEFNREYEKLQNSWSYWELGRSEGSQPDTIWCLKVIREELYIVIGRKTAASFAYTMEKVNFNEDKADVNGVDILLDRLVQIGASDMSYDAAKDQTTITLPYDDNSRTTQVIRETGFSQGVGQIEPIAEWVSDNQFRLTEYAGFPTISGDFTSNTFLVGQPYLYKLKFQQFYVRTDKGSVINNSKFNIKWFIVNYVNSGLFEVDVERTYDSTTYTFYKKPTRLQSQTLDEAAFDDGEFKVSVATDSTIVRITLKNDSPYNTFFYSGELIGDLASNTFGRRV